MLALSHAAGTPESGTLETSQDSEPLSDPDGPPTASSAPVAQAPPLLAGAPGTIIVTLSQLRGIRGWWRKLAPAAASAARAGLHRPDRPGRRHRLRDRRGPVRRQDPVHAHLQHPRPRSTSASATPATPSPSGVVCGACRTKIDEQALADPADRGEASWRHQVMVVPVGQEPGKQDQEALHRGPGPACRLAGPRRIAVLGCARGAGQTLTVQMTGHVLASLRRAAVAAVDLNPGATSLAARRAPAVSVRSLPGRRAARRAGQRRGREARGGR